MGVHQGTAAWHNARAHSLASDGALAAYEREQVTMYLTASIETVDGGFNDLCGVATDAVYALIGTPAPTVAAAADKLARYMQHEVYANFDGAEMLGHILADLNRLAGREAASSFGSQAAGEG